MADLLDSDAPDVEDFMVCWLAPLGRVSVDRPTGDVLPYRLVTRIAGSDDECQGIDTAVVSVHTFASDVQAASLAAKETHRRMMYLSRHLDVVELSDGSFANAEYVETVQKPIRVDYGDDQIVRYVARYQVGLSYAAV